LSLLNSITSGAWAIAPHLAVGYLPFVTTLLEGKDPSKMLPTQQKVDISYKSSAKIKIQAGSSMSRSGQRIAIMTIKGVLTKDDGMCSAGMLSMNRMLNNIINDPQVGGILLDIDSPGGEASYTPIFAETIKNSPKPIVTYTSRMMASAAYWIGSSAKEVYASHANDEVGSIGTMITLADLRSKLEKDGVKIVDIYATKSAEKNGIYKAFLDGDYELIQKEMLDPINEDFLSTIKSNREISDEKAFTGRIFRAVNAAENGMIDGIKSFDQVLTRLQDLVDAEQSRETTPKTNTRMDKHIQTVANFLGHPSLESTDGHVSLSQEDIAKIGEKLAATNNAEPSANNSEEEESANPELAEISQQLAEISAQNQALSESFESLNGRVDTIEGKSPAAQPSASAAPEETETDPESKSTLHPWEDPNDPINKATKARIGK
jgi:signal peptide peptidase SppA